MDSATESLVEKHGRIVRRWFRSVRGEMCPMIMKWANERGDTPVNYVEIGVWYGTASKWVAQNVLSRHKESYGWGIDPYLPDHKRPQDVTDAIYEAAKQNVLGVAGKKYSFIRRKSGDVLPTWGKRIDLLYIDGVHLAPWTLSDFVMAFPWLTEGSLVIFDDWGIGKRKQFPHVPEAVQAVEIAFAGMIERYEPFIERAAQAAFRVVRTQPDLGWYRDAYIDRSGCEPPKWKRKEQQNAASADA